MKLTKVRDAAVKPEWRGIVYLGWITGGRKSDSQKSGLSFSLGRKTWLLTWNVK